MDPFGGSGTTGVAAAKENKLFVLIDNNAEYCKQAQQRLRKESDMNIAIVSDLSDNPTEISFQTSSLNFN